MFVQAAASIQDGGRTSDRAARRTHQPVRRKSHLAGKHDRQFWKPTSRKEVAQIVLAAKRYELGTREAGKRNGRLGFVAIEVLELFANMVSYRTGQLDPSIDTLMRKLRRSRDAIVRALRALRDHGFLDWLRRYVPTGNEGRGVQVKQTSNAYRLLLPQKLVQWLGAWGWSVPLPDDFSHATEARRAEMDAYEATLTPEAYALHRIEDENLAATVAAFLKAAQSRNNVSTGGGLNPCLDI